MKTLKLEHLAPYLPYGLKGNFNVSEVVPDAKFELIEKLLTTDNVDFFLKYATPILRPLSDLTKEIEVDGEEFIPIDYINLMDYDLYSLLYIENHTYRLPYQIFNKLLQWHFDVFGLIQNDLAIDINTLTK